MTAIADDFYVAGGTLKRDAACYVHRRADAALHAALSSGSFAYVLTSRQMGKSSLMVRTAARLRDEGRTIALVDLTAIGRNVTPEQWYSGLIAAVAEQLDREEELAAWWRESPAEGALRRWQTTMRRLVGARDTDRIVVFIDEIDSVRSLPFSTDEFFAGIRELYNRRADETALERLTFCLLGVASPAELIRDTRTTPFDIGRRIELNDFTRDEALALVPGFGRDSVTGRLLLDRVLYWTNGHPYLTQRLCQAVAELPAAVPPQDVDRCCTELFLSPRARERDDNLLFVRERLLGTGAELSDVLELVDRIRGPGVVKDDEQNARIDLLRLSGLTATRDGCVRIRNRIYARAFNAQWVQSSLPGAERRRQRAAYRRGLLRASLIAATVVLALGALAVTAQQQRDRAVAQEAANRQLLYAAEMNLAQQAWGHGDAGRVLELLTKTTPAAGAPDPRGFEWRYLWHVTHAYERIFIGHGEPVTALDVSRDGRYLATAAWDGTARVWDLASATTLLALTSGDANLVSIAFSPDGRRLVTAGGTIRIWDRQTGEALGTLEGHRGRVNRVVFSPDGRLLASAGWDRTVRLWDMTSLTPAAIFEGHADRVNAVVFHPDGRRLATGSLDGTVRLWDVATGRMEMFVDAPGDDFECVAFSPDGSLLALGGWHDGIEVWNLRDRRPVARLRGHNAMVSSAVFSADGRLLLSGGLDGTARVWDVASGAEVRSVTVNEGRAVSAVLFADASTFLTGGRSNAAELWRLDVEQHAQVLNAHEAPVSSVAFSPDGRVLASSGFDGTARLWDAATHALRGVLDHGSQRVQRAEFSSDGRHVMTSGYLPGVRVWDVADGRLRAALDDSINPLFMPGLAGILAKADSMFELRNPDRGHIVRRWPDPENWGLGAITPDGRQVILIKDDGHVQVRNAATMRLERSLRPHVDAISAVIFSPDRSLMAVAALDGLITLWSGERLVATLRGHKGWINSIAFSPDGRRLASASLDRTVKIWDVVHHQELVTLTGHASSVTAVAFSPDGETLVSGGADHTLRVWRASAR